MTPTGKRCAVLLKVSKFIKSLSLGGTVHMVCRNEDRANEARKDVVEQSKNEVYFQKYVQIIRKLFYMV